MGYLAIFILVFAGWFLWSRRKKAKQFERQLEIQQAFDALALHILKTRLSQEEYKKLFAAFRGDCRSDLIGSLKQINESVYLATTSKKQDVAESRMAFAAECRDRIEASLTSLVSHSVFMEIDQYVNDAQEQFNTRMYVNVSTGHIEKADSVKTTKAKLKYLWLARDILEVGIKAGKGDVAELESALNSVSATMALLN